MGEDRFGPDGSSHTIGILGALADGPSVGLLIPDSMYSIVAGAVGGGAVPMLWKGRRDGYFAAVFAGVLLAVFGGLADVSVLDHSQVPFAWSAASARLLVASTAGLGFAVAVGSMLALWRRGALRARRPAAATTPPTPTID